MPKANNYIFTWNNPTCNLEELEYIVRSTDAASFIAQLEKGENGTPHFQFFVHYEHKRHFTAVKKQFAHCHIEAAKSAYDAWQYCSKEESRLEGPIHFGTMPKPQKKKDKTWKSFNEQVLSEGPERMVEDGRLSIKDYKKLKEGIALYRLNTAACPNMDKLTNVWYYGASGAGKTSTVHKKEDSLYDKPISKWWDGYKHEDAVIIDDLDPKHADWIGYYLKRWGDHYPFNAETKGGTVRIRPLRIYVTSQYHPDQIWKDKET